MIALLFGCAGGAPSDTGWQACGQSGSLDATLTVADVQALGTHNSYHVEPDSVVDASHAYTQPALDAQAELGVRAFELDVHLGEDGIFQVFHLPVIDPETTCATLGDCLGVLLAWSDTNPCHSPFTVWIEPKDDLDAAVDDLVPLAGHLLELDAAITAVWPRGKLLLPDDVRGVYTTLTEGVAAGWPLLAESRGKLMVAMLDGAEARAEYLDGAPSLEGRVLFVGADTAADPFAAVFKINDAVADATNISMFIGANFMVTSNVDSAANDDETNAADYAGALAAGPHFLASDRVVPTAGSAYVAELPDGSPRCHPGRVPAGCTAADIEGE